MTLNVKIEGLREVDRALGTLPKATGKNVLRRVLRNRAKPIAEDMRAKAPVDPEPGGGELRDSIRVGTRLSSRQAKIHKRMFRDDRAAVEMFVGAGPVSQAHLQEFGTVNHGPQSFARPAWDGNRTRMLEGIKDDLWREIDKAAKRVARKRAKALKV